jgi:putative DNA methylase
VYEKTRIEGEVPVESLYELAVREGNSKKPVYEIHKWWARRLGSVFRMLLLLATASEQQTDDELWARFYKGDNLSHLRMLDPFMGGGTSVVEAAKLHFQTAGIDIDPVAWFITRQEVAPCNIDGINDELERLETSDMVSQIRRFYQTSLSQSIIRKHNDENRTEEADIIYNFWVDVLTCPHCHTSFEAHNHYRLLYHAEKSSQIAFCKTCHHSTMVSISEQFLHCQHCAEVTEIGNGPIKNGNFTCPTCSYKGRIVDLPQLGTPLPKRWFAIEYLEPKTNRRVFKVPDASDFARYAEAERLLETQLSALPIPNREIPLMNREDPRPTTHGYAFYKQLFNARQLLTLGWLLQWISTISDLEIRNYFVLAFSDALAANNQLCSFAYGYDKLTPLFGLHAYNMINRPVENNVWGTVFGRGSFKRCLRKVIEGKKYCAEPYESRYRGASGNLEKVFVPSPINPYLVTTGEDWYEQKDIQKAHCLLLNQSSESLSVIRTGTIDIILTDPPYYNNLSYSELSDFYYAWIEPFLTETGAKWQASTTPYDKALFVKKRKQVRESISKFINGLLSVFTECHRVLQEHGLFIFTYHHLDAAAWVPLTQALLHTNFVITNVFPVRSEGRGQFHSTEGTIKWDAVIVCRKAGRKKDVYDAGEGSLKGTDLSTVLFTPAIRSAFCWQKRLLSAELPFAWPDVLSLGYAFVLQHLTQLPSEHIRSLNINTLLSQFSTHITKQLPEDAQLCIRKRKKHGVL